jgi:serine/threonine-protein kinase
MTSPGDPRHAADSDEPSWTTLFADVPLQGPRSRRHARMVMLLKVTAAVAVVAVVGGLVVWWLIRSPSDAPSASESSSTPTTPAVPPPQLARLVAGIFPPGTCRLADTPKGAVAAMTCGATVDAGGPRSTTYTLLDEPQALAAAFTDVMRGATRVDCPFRIQSPGPWRASASATSPSGVLFCGNDDGAPMVAWTTDADSTLTVARSGIGGPALDALYRWWSLHS